MNNQLINKFNEFNKESYYQDIDNSIDEIISSCMEIRNDNNLSDEDKTAAIIRQQEEVIKILQSSGIVNEDIPFEFEREFFTDGTLNQSKLNSFKKEILHSLSHEEMKWIFAGTAGSYTKITEKTLTKQNKSLNDLLPNEIKLKKDNSKKITRQSPQNVYNIFAYPDGTLSSMFDSGRAQFSFDQTKDRSGVPWGDGYNSDMEMNKNWMAGFNKSGVWERFTIIEPKLDRNTITAEYTNPLISFASEPAVNMDYIYVIDINNKDGILYDDKGLLINEQEEKYYSITGLPYADRKTDPVGTAIKLKQQLELKGIEYFSTVIVPDKSEETKALYKKTLGDMIDDNTEFRNIADTQLSSDLAKLKETIIENTASSKIIERYKVLHSQGYDGDELYQGLEHDNVSPVIEHGLSIFAGDKDIETFVSIPVIHEAVDDDTISYMKSLNIPDDKKLPMSNAVQNLLHSYTNLFQYSGASPKEVITYIYETIVQGNTKKVSKIHIPGECTLSDYIAQQDPKYKKVTVPAFHSSKKEGTVPNLFNDEEFNLWQKDVNELLNNEITQQIKGTIKNTDIDKTQEKIVSHIIISAFHEFKQIQESTGITPSEFTQDIISFATGRSGLKHGSKRILFNKRLDKLITEASLGTKHSISVNKKAILSPNIYRVNVEEYDLFNEDTLDTFVSSIEFKRFGLDASEIEEFSLSIKETTLPDEKRYEFVQNLLTVLPLYKDNLYKQGYDVKRLIKAGAAFAQRMETQDAKDFSALIKKSKQSADKKTLTDLLSSLTLTDDKIENLLYQYKHEYNNENLFRIKPDYKSIPVVSDESNKAIETDFLNIGLKIIKRPGREQQVIQLQPASKKKNSAIIRNILKSNNIQDAISTAAYNGRLSSIEQMEYAPPAIRISSITDNISNQFMVNTDRQNDEIRSYSEKYSTGNMSAGMPNMEHKDEDTDIKMQRIIENYDYDKRKLAKQDDGASSGSRSRSGNDKGDDVKKVIDALYEEFKGDVKNRL